VTGFRGNFINELIGISISISKCQLNPFKYNPLDTFLGHATVRGLYVKIRLLYGSLAGAKCSCKCK